MSTWDEKKGLNKLLHEMDQARKRNQEIFGNPDQVTNSEKLAETAEEKVVTTTEQPPIPLKPIEAKKSRGYLKRIIVYPVIAWIGVHVLLGTMQRQMIYLGSKNPAGDPVNYGFVQGEVREIYFTPEKEVKLAGWHVLPIGITTEMWDRQLKEFNAQNKDAKKYLDETVILYFPGNAGHRGYRHETLKDLASLKAHVVIFDYRGYSDSTGSPSEKALVNDARKIYDYLKEDLKFKPERIVLFGESLGGGVSTQLAAELGREKLPLGGLVIQSSFDSLQNVAQQRFKYLAVSWLLLDKFLSINHISDIDCALLSIHGQQDEVIPFELGKKLFSAAPVTSAKGILKEFYQIPLCGHNDVREAGGMELKKKLGEFIRKVETVSR